MVRFGRHGPGEYSDVEHFFFGSVDTGFGQSIKTQKDATHPSTHAHTHTRTYTQKDLNNGFPEDGWYASGTFLMAQQIQNGRATAAQWHGCTKQACTAPSGRGQPARRQKLFLPTSDRLIYLARIGILDAFLAAFLLIIVSPHVTFSLFALISVVKFYALDLVILSDWIFFYSKWSDCSGWAWNGPRIIIY